MKKQYLLSFALFLGCFFPVSLYSQVQVLPFVNSHQQFFNGGSPCNGCQLFTYSAGTTTPLATYSDSLGTVLNMNPVVLASDGSATIYLQLASYKFVLQTAGGASIWTQDGVTANNIASTLASLTISGAGPVTINTATAATGAANQSGPSSKLCGNFWNGAASAADCWTFQDVLGTGTNPTSTLTGSHSGSSGTATFSVPALSAVSATTTTSFNNRVWVGPSPFSHTTIENGLTDNLLSPTGSNFSQLDVAPGFSETGPATTVTFGNGGTQHINSTWFGPSIFTCTVASLDCILLKAGSQIHCQMIGATSGGAGQGCIIQSPFTGTVTSLVTSDIAGSVNPYFRIEKMVLQAGQSGNFTTINTACLNVMNTAFMSVVNDVVINGCNGVGINVAANSVASSGQGPTNINNVWVDGFVQANAIPCQITTTAGYVLPILWNGGVCNHPGLNKPAFLANNGGGLGQMRGLSIHTYAENLTALNNNILFQFKNTFNVNMSGSVGFGQPGDTGIDISQPAGAGNLCGFHVAPFNINSGFNTGNILNNHISSITILAANYKVLPFYNFGGDASCPSAPAIFDSSTVALAGVGSLFHIYHTIDSFPPTNYSRFYIDPSGSSVVIGTQHGGTGAAEGLTLNSDSGNITTQSNGTNEWQFSNNLLKCLSTNCTIGGSGNPSITVPTTCQTSQKAETTADTSVLSCTPLVAAGSYRVRFVMSVSAANTATLGWTATWHDSNSNAQAPTNLSLFQMGTAAPALTFATSAAGNYYGYLDLDVDNSGTPIVIKLTFTGTSFAAKVSATVERII